MATISDALPRSPSRGSAGEVFLTFLKLGLTSFGGPIAHLGYFRDEIVIRRQWIDEAGYADLVALCQFLPGPASSQVGFALGLARGGPLGALAAWTAFTLPSALLLVAFAYAASAFSGPVGVAVIHGLKLVAVAIVAQAVFGMAKTLTPDRTRVTIAIAALALVVLVGGALGQVGPIVGGAIAGFWLCRDAKTVTIGHMAFSVRRWVAAASFLLFIGLLIGLPLVRTATGSHGLALFDAFYRSGALVFGGGHVVLPLLQAEVVPPGWINNDAFLAGYGAAQAVPGPLFTFAAYLGAAMGPTPNGPLGAAIALLAVFLPGLLILIAALPFWDALRTKPPLQAALRGTNAAVVGILGAALYNPVWTSAVLSPRDFLLALVGFVGLIVWRWPPWAVVTGVTSGAVGLSLL